MIILAWDTGSAAAPSKHLALIFGVGLIGQAIQASLVRRGASVTHRLPFSWDDPTQQAKQLEAIARTAREQSQNGAKNCSVDVVWSAGRAGFGSSAGNLATEHEAFERIVRASLKLKSTHRTVRYHMMSSAGGLFEGQRLVDSTSIVHPLRPYGEAKLRQERALPELLGNAVPYFVYRPSSVYGFGARGARVGMIVALIRAALQYRTMRIFARPDTLRDYALAEDIGGFVADRILSRHNQSETHLLASGKATSIFELVALVERLIDRRLLVQYEPVADNALPNTYRPSLLPADWLPTSLEFGVHRSAMRIRASIIGT